MVNILVHVKSAEEQRFLEDLLSKLNISYENMESVSVSESELASIQRGIDDADNGRLASSEEIFAKAMTLCSK